MANKDQSKSKKDAKKPKASKAPKMPQPAKRGGARGKK
jgi:hypothetical protein